MVTSPALRMQATSSGVLMARREARSREQLFTSMAGNFSRMRRAYCSAGVGAAFMLRRSKAK